MHYFAKYILPSLITGILVGLILAFFTPIFQNRAERKYAFYQAQTQLLHQIGTNFQGYRLSRWRLNEIALAEKKYHLTAIEKKRKEHYVNLRDQYALNLDAALDLAESYFNMQTKTVIQKYLAWSIKNENKTVKQQPSDAAYKRYQNKIMTLIVKQLN